MSEATYPPQTVALVALGSLVAGFVVVFGGGMILLRPRSTETTTTTTSALPPPTLTRSTERDAAVAPLVDPLAQSAGDSSAPEPNGGGETDPTALPPTAGEPSTPPPAGSATVGVPAISRCFDAGPPTPIAGANCGQLAALQQHIASKSSALAQCARGGHGRLSLVLDFRFSTSFVRGWGSPASTVPRAGDVTACAKNAIFPLPFASMPHDHDRYIVTVPIDF
ncbi:MAG: hypothetical protein U0269_37420 [Polyangiales bacterium]